MIRHSTENMKSFIALLATLALVSAEAVLPYAKVEGDGQEYHFGYNDGQTARQEIRTADGVVRGAYSYVDANGEIQTVRYTSDAYNGYVVLDNEGKSSSGVEYTPEVKAAREAHLAHVNNVQHTGQILVQQPHTIQYEPVVMPPTLFAPLANTYASQPVVPQQVVLQGGQYIADSPDVLAAKLAHYEELRKAGLNVEIPAYLQPTLQQGPVQYTPEVAAARAAHFEAIRRAMTQF